MNLKIIIRKANEADFNLILSTWMKSYKQLGRNGFRCSGEVFYKEHQKKIKDQLKNCWVASPENDEDQVFGWICFDSKCIHYVYVKGPFRNFGISKELISKASSAKEFSHDTKEIEKIKLTGLTYNPYAFYKE